ncbi:MAG: glycosyltransferase [Clostridia bacterium]
MPEKIGIDVTNIVNMDSLSGEEIVTLSIVDGICSSGRADRFILFALASVRQQILARYRGVEIVGVKSGGSKFYKRILPRAIRRKKITVIHYPHCHKHIQMKLRARIIVTVHGLLSKDLSKREIKRTAKKIRQADTIVAVSGFVRDELQERMKLDRESILVIGNCLYDVRPGIDIVYKRKYLLAVNSDSPQKNLIALVKAFHAIRDRMEHDLVIIGRVDEQSKAYRYMKRHRLTRRIIITGHMNRDTLFGYYKNADLFICTSKYEGFGLTPLEAMASGTRVLTTLTPSLTGNLNVHPDGIITDPDDVRKIAAVIMEIIRKPADKDALQLRALRVKEQFHPMGMIREYFKAYGLD